ncbi:MAG: PhoX family phosphatase [Polynucleobacter sp.]|nr:PhoX family phosphatase [Polynucleobacter sp.]
MNEFDDIVVNPHYKSINLDQVSKKRRRFLVSSAGLLGLFTSHNLAFAKSDTSMDWAGSSKTIGFNPVPLNQATDSVIVPDGYTWTVVAAWGDPINGKAPVISSDVSDNSEQQAKQFGMHHDGCNYFPDQVSSNHGLLAVNHEYTDDGLLHPNGMGDWNLDKVRKSQAAHGVSVAHIQKTNSGSWQVVTGPCARRITAYSPCQMSGPASGSDLLKTQSDPSGKMVLGTLNNCASGQTPWGTFLTCEENINGYFTKQGQLNKEESRIGITSKGFGYRWHEFDERFNVDLNPNEVNRFGWVVEIDPRDPNRAPIKRTALGRFKHEGAEITLGKNGQVVAYMGDDQKGEYVYRFVSKNKYDPKQSNIDSGLLDEGTLYVAQFNNDGSGRWIPLIHGENGLTSANGFIDQAYILINARLAADHVKATSMDRAEWIAVHPKSSEVYVALTNNNERGTRFPLNGVNPRSNNLMGQIVRWRPTKNDAASDSFIWDLFVLGGDSQNTDLNQQGNVQGDKFGSPDGLQFDLRGILWTQTDISTNTLGKGPYKNITNNMMFAANPVTKEFKRFLIGPNGCEITGMDMTPDFKTMFISIQHPGETASERSDPYKPKAISDWPDGAKFSRPRSATIAIWRKDGKTVGS